MSASWGIWANWRMRPGKRGDPGVGWYAAGPLGLSFRGTQQEATEYAKLLDAHGPHAHAFTYRARRRTAT